jgi:hypothetical protein
VEQFKEEERG